MHLKNIIDYVVDTNLSIFIFTNKSLGSIIHRIIPGNPSNDWNFPKLIFGNLFIFKKCSPIFFSNTQFFFCTLIHNFAA